MSARSWCFTVNNYTDEELSALNQIDCRYIICGKETGEQGTKHIQGYLEFNKVYRFSGIKKLMPRAHLEIRKGTREQARDYCMKEGDFWERGNWAAGGQGKRTDLDFIRNLAQEEGMRSVTAVGNAQQIKIAEKYLTYNEEPRDWKPEVIWFHGPTGTGKSQRAHEMCGEDTYRKANGAKWWNGYDGHENVIIDDFRDSWWSLTDMLSILDKYEHRVECKGGERQLRAKRIIVTSAKAPEECYKGCGEDIQQLLRRINTVTRCCNEVAGNTETATTIQAIEDILKALDGAPDNIE